MSQILGVVSAEPVIHGVLKIIWNDGYAGSVDFRHLLATGKVYFPLRDRDFFQSVKVTEDGHFIAWIDGAGRQMDLGADALQELSRTQADLVLKAWRAA